MNIYILHHHQNGELENTAQSNCPASATCTDLESCDCPLDNMGGKGAFINVGQAIQCAYGHGACTFNTVSLLVIKYLSDVKRSMYLIATNIFCSVWRQYERIGSNQLSRICAV